MKKIVTYLQTADINSIIINLLYFCIIISAFYLMGIFVGRFVIRLSNINLKKQEKDNKKKNINYKEEPLYKSILRAFVVTGIFVSLISFELESNTLSIVLTVYEIILILLIASILSNLVTRNLFLVKPVQEKLRLGKDNTINKLVAKTLKVVIYVIAIGMVINRLGYDINGIFTGLGLTSVVIALAAQDTFKNLFGGLLILLDRPFLVNDWIQLTNVDIEGIVEDITFRSTRIRTFKDSLITIPNSTIVNESIINWSKMHNRRININIQVSLDTPLKSLSNAISQIELMLMEHPDVNNDKMYIHFDDIKSNGYNIYIGYFTKRTTYSEFLILKENINYKIIHILESNKIKLAHNAHDVYLQNKC